MYPVDYFKQTSNPDYSYFIYLSRYARWRDDLGRREMWPETVQRYVDFYSEKVPQAKDYLQTTAKDAILNLEVMPSMRALMTAGKAAEKDECSTYNCSFIAIDHPRAFDEVLYILCCGTGAGISVERQYVTKLPNVAEEFFPTDTTIVVRDSKIGWATAFKELIAMLYHGQVPKWDMSKVRPAGARLKIFGGRASGPDPLDNLFRFTVETFKNAAGRKLTSIECHDLICKVAEIVVCGGVRRSALISLSNLSDDRMRKAKSGDWWVINPHRAMANNSVCYTEKPDMQQFMEEWKALYESKAGERGMFSHYGAMKHMPERRKEKGYQHFGTNPCGEILLRAEGQMCNLSTIIVREEDKEQDLLRKIEIAAVLGTCQAALTNFRYLRPIWKKNIEEEALLGVSMTGIMDNPLLSGGCDRLDLVLHKLKNKIIETNKEWAERIGINQATAVSAIKPEGTTSQLTDSSSGIHGRFSPFYIRRVRNDKKDPLSSFMIDQGVPHEEDKFNSNTWVFSFPMKAPKASKLASELTALQQLDHWMMYKMNYTEHNPSVTIYVREHEWLDVGAWVYKNFDNVVGLSFLPYSDHTYQQAPYDAITEEEYERLVAAFPAQIDWGKAAAFEAEDQTTNSKELACTAGACEIQ